MKTFVKYSALGVLTLGLIGTSITAASAHQNGKREGRERPTFEMLDANSDGFLTSEDITARRKEHFASIDTDGDGFVTLEELQAAPLGRGPMGGGFGPRGDHGGKGGAEHAGKRGQGYQPSDEEMADRAQRMLRYLDENGDGKVAFDELPVRGGENRMMARLDTNEDGKISKAEFEVVRGFFGKRHMRHGQPDAQ